jgi:hypothetical protein
MSPKQAIRNLTHQDSDPADPFGGMCYEEVRREDVADYIRVLQARLKKAEAEVKYFHEVRKAKLKESLKGPLKTH